MTKFAYALSILAVCFAGAPLSSDAQTISVDLAGMGERVIPELEVQEIWYRRAGFGTIEVETADAQQVIEILNEASYGLLPPGRSRSFNPKVQPVLKQRLEDQDIAFETVCFEGSEFLVWESGASQKVEAIYNEVFEELADQGTLETEPASLRPATCP